MSSAAPTYASRVDNMAAIQKFSQHLLLGTFAATAHQLGSRFFSMSITASVQAVAAGIKKMKGIETAFRGQGITGGRAGKMAKKAMEAEALGKKPKKRLQQRHESASKRGACCMSLHDLCARLHVSSKCT